MITTRTLSAVVAANAVAAAALFTVWWVAADRVRVADQLPMLALAGLAVLFACAVDAGVVVSARRQVGQRAAALVAWAGTASSAGASSPAETLGLVAGAEGEPNQADVVVAGGRLAHRPDCQLAVGKSTSPAAPDLRTCEVCHR